MVNNEEYVPHEQLCKNILLTWIKKDFIKESNVINMNL